MVGSGGLREELEGAAPQAYGPAAAGGALTARAGSADGATQAIQGFFPTESLILAQDERWRCALYMQVVRERSLRGPSRAANGCVTREQPALQWGITPRNRG